MSAVRTCDCMACSKCRAREWARARYRQKAYGQWNPHGDLEAVRQHIANLRESGLGINAIAVASGIGRSQVGRIAAGQTKRIAKETAAKLLAVDVDDKLRRPSLPIRRRLQALNAIGYSTRHLAALLGMTQETVSDHLVGHRHWVFVATDEKVRDLYERLCMIPGGNEASARIAHAKGYKTPLAWDDIDDPNEVPDESNAPQMVDEEVVRRLLNGRRLPSNKAEKVEAMRRWLAMGNSERSLCDAHGWGYGRYVERKEESVFRYHLAVANWLDRAASFWEHPDLARQGRPADLNHAREVACAYLGSES